VIFTKVSKIFGRIILQEKIFFLTKMNIKKKAIQIG
jgi:hypothetical protein